MLLQVRVRDTDNDRLYSFELTEQLLSGSQVEAWKEIAAKTLAEGGDEADMKPLHPLKGTHGTGKCSLIFKDGFYRMAIPFLLTYKWANKYNDTTVTEV